VSQLDVDSTRRRGPAAPPLTLYVEGPQDRSILRAWAYRFMPSRARALLQTSVILGGRRPARAIEDFRRRLDTEPEARALCVLDRDDGEERPPDANGYAMDFFTWGRRHIDGDRSIARLLDGHLPSAGDESAWRRLDAKRVLSSRGLLPLALGRPLPLARIARATREQELHSDVHALFERLRELLGEAKAR
jgi:hypothetical protein